MCRPLHDRPQDTADSGRAEAEQAHRGICGPLRTLCMFCIRVVREGFEISIGMGGG